MLQGWQMKLKSLCLKKQLLIQNCMFCMQDFSWMQCLDGGKVKFCVCGKKVSIFVAMFFQKKTASSEA